MVANVRLTNQVTRGYDVCTSKSLTHRVLTTNKQAVQKNDRPVRMFAAFVTILGINHEKHVSFSREQCLSSVSDTFNIWKRIKPDCKDKLYKNDHRWHDYAMMAEQRDAERFCREGHREAIARDTYAADMATDIFDAINYINNDAHNQTRSPEQGVGSVSSVIC